MSVIYLNNVAKYWCIGSEQIEINSIDIGDWIYVVISANTIS